MCFRVAREWNRNLAAAGANGVPCRRWAATAAFEAAEPAEDPNTP